MPSDSGHFTCAGSIVIGTGLGAGLLGVAFFALRLRITRDRHEQTTRTAAATVRIVRV